MTTNNNKHYKRRVHKLIILACIFLTFQTLQAQQTNIWKPSDGRKQMYIWPHNKIPDSVTTSPEYSTTTKELFGNKPCTVVNNVSRPTITIYTPKGKNTGAAIVVFPGGGYRCLAIDLEGSEICEWLTSIGITGILLKYRVPGSGPHWDPELRRHIDPKIHTALQDAQRTIGIIRYFAKRLHINPRKIGVLGFSAGGHLVADISTHYKKRLYKPIDIADRVSCRPDFAAVIYPGHMQEHITKEFELNPTILVSKNTPPTFILQAEDDPIDSVNNSLVYYIALNKAKVPVEMHLYAHGGHAFGLRSTKYPITQWPQLFKKWLITIGMISK